MVRYGTLFLFLKQIGINIVFVGIPSNTIILKIIKLVASLIVVFNSLNAIAQQDTSSFLHKRPVENSGLVIDSSKQKDVIDLIYTILKKDTATEKRKSQKAYFSIVPAIGYSLTTGFALDLTGNVAFYTSSSHNENLSAIDAELIFDTKNQIIFASRSEIWAVNNNYKLITDIRLEQYPISTYGIGVANSTSAKENPLEYKYVRTYVTVFKKITGELYGGVGYNLDYHFGITEKGNTDGTTPDFDKYGFNNTSTSSGVVLNLLFDNRRNPINPLNGGYASLLYKDNFTFLGSDHGWQEVQLDLRRYLKLSANSNNILAIWGIAEFTTGNVPYLDLPYTGSDTYNNSGRGYPEQRFRGKNELYLEGEYRFGISRNGFLGGVVFTNAETFSELQTNRFVKVAPSAGTGVRIKINKHSDTNVCLDYAVGIYGSHGLFVNLGEMF